MADVHVDDYGAQGGGADDSAAFAAAIAAAGVGGRVRFSGRHHIPQGITIPGWVRVEGPLKTLGQVYPPATGSYASLPGLVVTPGKPIKVKESASITGAVIMRAGLVEPFANAIEAAAGIAAFAGTAIELGGPDTLCEDLLILGSMKAIGTAANGAYRANITRVRFDCHNGIDLKKSHDISRLRDCHGWPYLTVHRTWSSGELFLRSGIAYNFVGINDWTQVHGCFSYGHLRGFRLTNSDSCVFVDCASDGPSGNLQADIGFEVLGLSTSNDFIGCKAVNKAHGFHMLLQNSVDTVNLTSCRFSGSSAAGIRVGKGSLLYTSGSVINSTNGVVIADPESRTRISDQVTFYGISGQIVANVGPTPYLADNGLRMSVAAAPPPPPVAIPILVSDPLPVTNAGNSFVANGNANFGSMLGGAPIGRVISVRFMNGPIIYNGPHMTTKTGANYRPAIGETVQFRARQNGWDQL